MMYILWGFLGAIALVVILFIGLTTRKAGRNRKGQAQTAPAAPAKKTSFAWLGWLIAIALVVIGVNWGYRYYKNATQPTAQKPAAAPAKPERVIEVTAPVGRWSENISIPLLHWFRIIPEGKIRIKMWNGREMDSEPGNDIWFGDNILDANFRFQSREEKPVTVKVVMRPK